MTEKHVPKTKRVAKPKLTDAERHQRFMEMAQEVGADEREVAFEKAFEKVTDGFSAKK